MPIAVAARSSLLFALATHSFTRMRFCFAVHVSFRFGPVFRCDSFVEQRQRGLLMNDVLLVRFSSFDLECVVLNSCVF